MPESVAAMSAKSVLNKFDGIPGKGTVSGRLTKLSGGMLTNPNGGVLLWYDSPKPGRDISLLIQLPSGDKPYYFWL